LDLRHPFFETVLRDGADFHSQDTRRGRHIEDSGLSDVQKREMDLSPPSVGLGRMTAECEQAADGLLSHEELFTQVN
jgi:hypothetical protein